MSAIPVNPDNRPLPPGWNEHYDMSTGAWYYVCMNVQPPQVSTTHPLGPPTPSPSVHPQGANQSADPQPQGLSAAQKLYLSAINQNQANLNAPPTTSPVSPTPVPHHAPHRSQSYYQTSDPSPRPHGSHLHRASTYTAGVHQASHSIPTHDTRAPPPSSEQLPSQEQSTSTPSSGYYNPQAQPGQQQPYPTADDAQAQINAQAAQQALLYQQLQYQQALQQQALQQQALQQQALQQQILLQQHQLQVQAQQLQQQRQQPTAGQQALGAFMQYERRHHPLLSLMAHSLAHSHSGGVGFGGGGAFGGGGGFGEGGGIDFSSFGGGTDFSSLMGGGGGLDPSMFMGGGFGDGGMDFSGFGGGGFGGGFGGGLC